MDAVYQAIKNFLKSFINLFVAIIELFTTLINGIAFVLRKLSPHISEKYAELKNNRNKTAETGRWTMTGKRENVLEWKDGEEELAEKIRAQLNEKITGRNQYLFLYAKVTEAYTGFYAIVLSVLALVLTGGITVCGGSVSGEMKIFALIFMTLACAVACVAIIRYQKKEIYNRMVRQILEEEFKDKFCEKTNGTDILTTEMMTVQESTSDDEDTAQKDDVSKEEDIKETSAEISALE